MVLSGRRDKNFATTHFHDWIWKRSNILMRLIKLSFQNRNGACHQSALEDMCVLLCEVDIKLISSRREAWTEQKHCFFSVKLRIDVSARTLQGVTISRDGETYSI